MQNGWFRLSTDPELLAWLHDPLDTEEPSAYTTHIDACASCQCRLAELDQAEERKAAVTGDDLLADLRRQLPVDELETEAECHPGAIGHGRSRGSRFRFAAPGYFRCFSR